MRPLLATLLLASLAVAGCANLDAASNDPVQPAATGLSDAVGFAPVLALQRTVDEAVAAGTPLNLTAMAEADLRGTGMLGPPRQISVILRPSQVLNESTWAEIDGVRVPFPDVRAYEGEVEGRPDSVVRLTVTDEWARGNIRMADTQYLVRMGLAGNLPFPSEVGTPPSAPSNASSATVASMTYSWTEAPLTFYDKDGLEEEDCLRLVPPDVKPMVDPLPGPTEEAPLVARIVLDADAQYLNQTGRHAFPLMVAFLNEVDSIYQHEVGVRFQLVGVHGNTDPSYYPDPGDEAPLGKLAEYWNPRTDVPRDMVHVFTGQPSSYAQANCIGGAGKPEIAYTFTPLNWARDYVVFHEQAMAHELGHIFSAHHHYGNHVEATWGNGRTAGGTPLEQNGAAQAGLATIMIQGYTPGAKPVFGTMEKSVIRGWAEKHLGQHDAAHHDE